MSELSRSRDRVRSSSNDETMPPLVPAARVCHQIIFFLMVALLAGVPLVPAAWEPWARNGMLCAVGLMVLLWILSQCFGYETHMVSTLLNAPMLLVGTYAVTRYGLSDVEWVARQDVLLLLGMTLLFFVVTNVIRHRWQFTWIMWAVIGVGLLLALEGFAQLLGNGGAASAEEVVRSTFREAADHLVFLHVAFSVAVATFLFSRRSLAEKILCAFAALILVAGMAATGNLQHWFGCLASVMVLGAYLLRKRGWKFHRILVGTAVAVAVVTITCLALIRMEGIAPPQRMISGASSTSTTVPLWRTAVTMSVRNPLIGVGPGMFSWRYPEFRGQQGSPDTAGSNSFTWLAEYGIIGALLALSAVVTFSIAAVQILNARAKRYSASTNSNRYAFTVGGLAIMASALVDVAITSGFDACSNQMTLVVLLGAALTCGLHNRNDHPDKTHIPGKHTVFRLTGIHRVMLTGGSLLALVLFLWLLVNTSPGAVLLARARQSVARNDSAGAEIMYRRAIRADERNFEAIVGLADLCAARNESNNHEQALSLYERALVLNPYAHQLNIKIANLYDAAGNREKANERIQLAIQSDPRNAAYHVARARHHLHWKENNLAEAAFERARKLDPEFVAAATNAPPTAIEP